MVVLHLIQRLLSIHRCDHPFGERWRGLALWPMNGLDAPQDDSVHVSKLLLIKPETGSTEVAANGLRNTQSLRLHQDAGDTYLVFADIGGDTAQDINAIAFAEVLDTSAIENSGGVFTSVGGIAFGRAWRFRGLVSPRLVRASCV